MSTPRRRPSPSPPKWAPTASNSTPSRSPAPSNRAPTTAWQVSGATPRPPRPPTGWDSGVNAGHDLDLRNLPLFRTLPHLDEVSIGHALMSHALFVGLSRAVRDYLDAVGAAQ
ncbi:MAG: pyridoxine 5'-phosphate synthase [Vicinamibacterales bacterium]